MRSEGSWVVEEKFDRLKRWKREAVGSMEVTVPNIEVDPRLAWTA
jgi:hypothetical protein